MALSLQDRSARLSVRVTRHVRAAAAYEDVEIRTKMSLLNVIGIELVPAARRCRNARPARSSQCELLFTHIEMQPTSGNVELDHVAGLDERQRSTGGGFR